MTTSLILTGTGVPHPAPGRAGAGALVRCGDVTLQFDAGRATVLRMVEAGVSPVDLTAAFVTHYHSDHVVDLADLAITRWVLQQTKTTGALTIVTPEGPARRFAERMLDAYDDDIEVRSHHTGAPPPRVDVRSFEPRHEPTAVWTSDDGTVRVSAIAVHHEPVEAAVAYRVDTPDGAVVISGDTRVCDEVFRLAEGADVLAHEACRKTGLGDSVKGSVFETIFSYHADTVELGAMAERHGIGHVVLTHLIPAPREERHEASFEKDLRNGGYTGTVTVGRDLMEIPVGGSR